MPEQTLPEEMKELAEHRLLQAYAQYENPYISGRKIEPEEIRANEPVPLSSLVPLDIDTRTAAQKGRDSLRIYGHKFDDEVKNHD